MRYCLSPRSLAILVGCIQFAAATASAHSPAEEMAQAATNFVAALTPEQQAKAVYEWKDEERFDWHFIPKPRKGLPFKEMTAAQRALAHALISSGLSQRGFAKAATIMSLEQVLFDLEDKAPRRNAELYYLTIFGKPGNDTWGWRVEGHHLSLNFALKEGEVLGVTPSFFGANPAKVQAGPRKGLRPLASEEDLGRQLVKSLNAEQRKVAVIATDAPRDIITGNDRKGKLLEPLGISSANLTPPQQELLLALLKDYLFRYRNEIAESALKKIQSPNHQPPLHFAWAGGLEPGQGHYYRIQGPAFLIEYDCTQDNANHIHTVWRDLEHDFGEDPLRAHYDQVPHSK